MKRVNKSFGVRLSAIAIALLVWGSMGSAKAGTLLCANQALQGGYPFGGGTDTISAFSGTQDAACGNTNSGETLAISTDQDYLKLEWDTISDPNGVSPQPLPSGLTVGGFSGASALVSFTGSAGDSPFFLLSFADPSGSFGQANTGDQILLIQDEDNSALSGAGFTTLGVDPNTTLFDLYDNTTDSYLSAYGVSQATPTTINALLAADSNLGGDSLNGVWLAIGLAGCSSGCPSESLQVDSASLTTPEPGSMALLFAGVCAVGVLRRRKA
jgi:hypothetical protein